MVKKVSKFYKKCGRSYHRYIARYTVIYIYIYRPIARIFERGVLFLGKGEGGINLIFINYS